MSVVEVQAGGTAKAPARSKIWRFWPLFPAALFLGFFFLYPSVLLLGLSLFDGQGALSAQHYTHLFASATYVKVLLITLKIAGLDDRLRDPGRLSRRLSAGDGEIVDP